MISWVSSKSRMFCFSKSSQSLGRQSGFSDHVFSSGLLSDMGLLDVWVSTSTRAQGHLPGLCLSSVHEEVPPTHSCSCLWEPAPVYSGEEVPVRRLSPALGGHPLWDPPSPWCLCEVGTSPEPGIAIFSATYKFFLALTLCSLVWSCFFQLCSILELASCV